MKSDRQRNEIVIQVPCRPEFVRIVRRVVADFAESLRVPTSVIAELEIAASEAVTNVVRHAYPGLVSPPPVSVTIARRNHALTVDVVDQGCGFVPPAESESAQVGIERDGGFGIVLMNTLMDSVNCVSMPHQGTRIHMTKRARRVLADAARRESPRASSPAR